MVKSADGAGDDRVLGDAVGGCGNVIMLLLLVAEVLLVAVKVAVKKLKNLKGKTIFLIQMGSLCKVIYEGRLPNI
jgi:hypothetical protein